MNNNKSAMITVITVVLVVIVFLVYWFALKPAIDANTKAQQLVNCTFNASDAVTTDNDYSTKLFVSDLSSSFSYINENQNLPLRTFSLADYADYKAKLKQDVFFLIRKTGGGPLAKIIQVDMQICNTSNKTNQANFISNSSENVLSMTLYIHGTTLPSDPGTYRIDGIIKVDGQDYLVGRIENVEFTP